MTALDVALLMISEGLLEVRPNGEIWKSLIRDRGGNRKPITPRRAETRSKTGYLLVKMNWQGRGWLEHAHRIVVAHRDGLIPDGMTVNHRNGVKDDNRPENLEVLSQAANNLHAYRTGLKQPAVRPILAEIAPRARALRAQGFAFAEIAKRLGVSQTSAFRAVNLSTPS